MVPGIVLAKFDSGCFFVEDVIKGVPIGCKSKGTKKLGYPKGCNHLWDYGGCVKIMGYPIICPAEFGA